MLCERGGLYDFVKVLDFGLVRPVQQSAELALTALDSLTGTPLYVPPEAIRAPETLDARADVYQLGQILYYLLVGRHLFQGDTAYDVLAQHVGTAPVPPSTALGRSVAPELEKLILWCLEKKPDHRPRDAADLLDALERCPLDGAWSQGDARAWWASWWEQHPRAVEPTPSTGGTPSGYTIDLAQRVSRAWRTVRE
jgi:serine/threonine-protein kinase